MSSIQSKLEQNDIPTSANEPGPTHYFGPDSQGFSSLGRQKFSKCVSAPEISLPRTGWNEWETILVTKAHQNAYKGRCSPGAKYEIPSTLDSKAPKIGTSLRPDLSMSLGVDPHGSPGPTINLRDGPSAQIGEGSPPPGRANKGFGLASRFHDFRGSSTTGPGQYRRKDSALRLDNGRSIGTGRAAWEKVITPGWECEGRCRQSPGVGPPLWSDPLKNGSRAMSIGKAERFPKKAAESCSPGPGAYRQDERQVCRTKQYISDTRSPVQITFGHLPKKPRYRVLLAQNCAGAKHGSWGYI